MGDLNNSWPPRFDREIHVLEPLSQESFHPTVLTAHPEFEPILRSVETLEEKLAANWCMDFYVALTAPRPHPWILVPYEKIVREGQAQIQRIFEALGIDVPARAEELLRAPSRTTVSDSYVALGKDRLMGWKERLNIRQVERVLRLVSRFGLDFYSDGVVPDYDRLFHETPTLVG